MVAVILALVLNGQNSAMYPVAYQAAGEGGAHVFLLARPNAPVRDLGRGHSPAVAMGGRYVAWCVGDPDGREDLVVTNGEGTVVASFASVGNTSFASPSFSPDGTLLTFVTMPRPQSRAATTDGPSVYVVRVRKGAVPTMVADTSGGPPLPSFLPGNGGIVLRMGENWVRYSLGSGESAALDTARWLRDLPAGHQVDQVVPFTAEPGKFLFSVSPKAGKGLRAVFLVNEGAASVARISAIGVEASSPAWAADGRTVLYKGSAEGKTGLYSVRSDGKDPNLVTLLGSG